MIKTNDSWSPELRKRTFDAIEDMLTSPIDNRLHFKNLDRSFGYMSLEDLMKERLELTDKNSGESVLFDSVEALLEAGWAVD